MKKIIISFLTLSILVLFASCSVTEETEEFSDLTLLNTSDDGNRLPFFDLESLESHSKIAVVGTFTDDSTQELTYRYEDIFGKDILAFVKSFNNIEVTKVLKGDVNEGDILKIGQNYAVVDDRLITDSALTPMMKGDTWIFFLVPSDSGEYYFCTGDSDGRYPVKNCEYAKIALTKNEELGVYDKKCFNEDIYNELLKKYEL